MPARVRDTRAGMFDEFESGTLGRRRRPAEMAATQKNWRHDYMTPGLELDLAPEQWAELGAQYGRLTLFGRPRCAKARTCWPRGSKAAPAIREAIAEQRKWLTDAPRDKRSAVLNRSCSPKDVRQRLSELDSLLK